MFYISVPKVQNERGEEESVQPLRPVCGLHGGPEEALPVLLAVPKALEEPRHSVRPLRQRRLRQQGPADPADVQGHQSARSGGRQQLPLGPSLSRVRPEGGTQPEVLQERRVSALQAGVLLRVPEPKGFVL